jgi:iron complex transport system substrate-binding protein
MFVSVNRELPLSRVLSSLVTGLALVVAGCSTGTSASTHTSAGTSTHAAPRDLPAGMGSTAADGAFPRSVGHFKGSTQVPAAPGRVVVISTGQADALLTLGVVPAASTRGDGADLIPRYLIDSFPHQADALRQVVDVGTRTEPSVEAIAAVRPDLILMNNAGSTSDALYRSLSALAPTVVTEGTGVNWKQDFLLVAAALGKTGEAKGDLDSYHTGAAALGASLGTVPTVSFLRKNGDRVRVFGVPSFVGSIAEDAGLPRPDSQRFDSTSQDISGEQLDRADADWVFYGVQGGLDAAGSLTALPLWSTLTAAGQGHAVRVDDDVFYLNAGLTAARIVLATLRQHLAG